MRKIGIGLLSLFLLINTSALAQERFYDIFSGTLENCDGGLIFIKCGHQSPPMKIVLVDDDGHASIDEAYDVMKNHQLVQVMRMHSILIQPASKNLPISHGMKTATCLIT